MKKLFIIVAATLVLFGGMASSSSAGYVYELSGILVNEFFTDLGGYPVGELTVPPLAELVFVDGFVPTPGGSFTEADIVSFAVWEQDRSSIIGDYIPESNETVTGTFSTTDITNGLPEIELFEHDAVFDVFALHADNTVTLTPNSTGEPLMLTDAMFVAQGDGLPIPEGYTAIQISGSESNIMTNVMAGDTVMFRIHAIAHASVEMMHFRFFTRAGYGEPDWGGNKWTIVQDFGPADSVFVTFNEAGIYFLAGHVERAGEPWAFGDPQTGIVVEVWPVQ
jgi:hypothetical protein